MNTQEALFQAVRAGNVELVKTLLDEGADVNERDEDGNMPLVFACRDDHLAIAQLLLEHGANPQVYNQGSFSPLIAACAIGNLAIVKILVTHGASCNEKIEYLPDERPGSYRTPLFYAVEYAYRARGSKVIKKCVDLVTFLLDNGADYKIRNHFGYNAFIYSAATVPEVVQVFLDHGVDVNVKARDGGTALYWACLSLEPDNSRSIMQIIKLLLHHGANPRQEDSESPLWVFENRLIPSHDAIAIIQELVNYGADPFHAVYICIEQGYYDLAKTIVEKLGTQIDEHEGILAREAYYFAQDDVRYPRNYFNELGSRVSSLHRLQEIVGWHAVLIMIKRYIKKFTYFLKTYLFSKQLATRSSLIKFLQNYISKHHDEIIECALNHPAGHFKMISLCVTRGYFDLVPIIIEKIGHQVNEYNKSWAYVALDCLNTYYSERCYDCSQKCDLSYQEFAEQYPEWFECKQFLEEYLSKHPKN